MTIDFGYSQVTSAKRQLMGLRRAGSLMSPERYYFTQLYPILLMGIGVAACWKLVTWPLFFAGGFLTGLHITHLLLKFRPYKKWLDDLIFSNKSDEELPIRIELADDGLREYRGNLISIAPWTDVGDSFIAEDLLVVALGNGMEAVIPRHSKDHPELDLEAIRTEIEARRVYEFAPCP